MDNDTKILKEDFEEDKIYAKVGALLRDVYGVKQEREHSYENFLSIFNKADNNRRKANMVVNSTHTFSEYLVGLINSYNIDEDSICAVTEISSPELIALKQGSVAPWNLPQSQIVSLIDVIYGSITDTIEKIRNTEVFVDEDRVIQEDLGLVARSERKRNVRRSDLFLDASKRIIMLDEQRKKNQLIEYLNKSIG